MYRHQRAEIRIRVRADAVFQLGRQEGRGRVRNLSAGGVEIRNPQPLPDVGTQASIHLIAADVTLGPLAGEVVRETAGGIAFRFLDVNAELRSEIISAIQRM
jgi:hypothetical protein